jgi:hypothetical protein
MRPTLRYSSHIALAVCAAATIGLLLWPAGSVPAPQRRSDPAYTGPVIELRRAAASPGFPIRTARPSADAEPERPTHPAPALVGLAGGAAYLRSSANGETVRIARGGELDGWTVVSIGARAVSLRGHGGERRLELFAAASADAPTPGTSPTSPQPTQGQ